MTGDLRIGPAEWEAAIAAVEGPQLVVAGPGTGKTEFLVRRAVHLIDGGFAPPDGVLVLTFSRRAAADLRRRIGDRLARSITTIAASTFHSFAHRLLEQHTEGGAIPTLLTGPEHVALVAELLRDEDPQRWPLTLRDLLASPTLAADVADFLLRCAERLIDTDELARRAAERPEWRALPAFATRYFRELAARRRIDYGTLLEQAVALLAEPAHVAALAEQYPYVLADEYQDTSPAQAALLDLVTRPHRNLTVAADPYQSVYSFRGADLTNVAAFPDRFRHPDGRPARRIVLTTSFRVPTEILAAALRVTTPGELPGSAGPVVPAARAGAVEAYVFDQASAEAEWIAAEVERLNLVDRLPFGAMAVLVRSKRHLLPELSRALHRRRIPHDTPDNRLVDHPAVQLVFDLARAAAGDDDERERAVRRILLGPLFAFPVGAERELLRVRRRSGEPWAEILRRSHAETSDLADLLAGPAWATSLPAIDGFWHAWQRLPQFERLVHDPACAEHRAAWSSFAQALERQAERDARVALLDYWRMTAEEDFEATPLLSYARSGDDRLTLTTLHQAKGLEFEVVIIADAAEGVFPDLRRGVSLLQPHLLGSSDPSGFARFRLQEEMRLAYTAMTRARRRVVWTATSAGIDEGERRPSRFLLAAAGVTERSAVSAPAPHLRPPVTAAEAEAALRRLVADPAAPPARRLAAAAVLAHPPVPLWEAGRFAGIRRPGPDRGVLGGRITLSPSQAEAYETCPRRYVLERRLGIGDTSSPYASFGSLVHLTLERAESAAHLAGADRAGVDQALAALDTVWEGADFGSPSLNRAWKRKAADLLARLYADWPPDSAELVATEHPLALELEGVEWRGRADRIERTTRGILRIVDYKTSTSIPSAAEAAGSLQLAYYLAAARADPEIADHGEVAEAELWYPRADRKDWRRRFDPANLTDATARLVTLGRGIAGEEWAPTVSKACGRCRLRLLCPLWPEGREAYS